MRVRRVGSDTRLRGCDLGVGEVEGIRHPGHIRYEHASDFMDWRVKSGASHNTARLELKFLSFVLQEAMRRDLIQKNPIALAKVPRAPAKLKQDLDSADFKKPVRLSLVPRSVRGC